MVESATGVAPGTSAPEARVGWGFIARYVLAFASTSLVLIAPLLVTLALKVERLVGSDASHAWVSVHIPAANGAGQWMDLDPTNGRAPGEDYVALAVGRDYSDVSPLRGVIHGGAHHRLHVAVTVTPTIAA